ncbi:hypothetical protein CANCADRAFT_3021 [Tortispora caseinolytica NRRL Y-17796]|uniref:Uncharacterized protein n=1 Tax=Tortispora caseinolytica NRRL Y-17796 TaxID=767744 RepID=A0A1E4THS2_9ASCO|nr:hypothetical protein CANCADRAFT_3021 [Tortispora caseinolytica NRRL Y-17796]
MMRQSLDDPDYDPLVDLSEIFSAENSLDELSEVLSLLNDRETALRETMLGLWARSVLASSAVDCAAMKTSLNAISKDLKNLESHSNTVKGNINPLTVDITLLDRTKSNLIESTTALRRLQMLNTAYNMLMNLRETKKYKEIAQLLGAAVELVEFFRPYRAMSQISELSKRVSQLQKSFSDQILLDFQNALSGKAPDLVKPNSNTLYESCLVLNILNDDSKDQLINWFCDQQLKEYNRIFDPSDVAGSLENTSRRYSYIRRILNSYSEQFSRFFLAEWNVGEELCLRFCIKTRDDIKQALRNVGSDVDVNLLLSALQETLEFEHSLDSIFSDSRNSFDTDTDKSAFDRIISEAFEPYLNVWVASQDKVIYSMVLSYKQENPLPAPPDEHDTVTDNMAAQDLSVIESSGNLFIYYRKILNQASKMSTGSALLDLYKVFVERLKQYSEVVLIGFIPKQCSSKEDLKLVSKIIRTADYCLHTTDQLEERMKSRIDKEYVNKISFDTVRDAFYSVTNSALKSLSDYFEAGCQPYWKELAAYNWSTMKQVGDQSGYVGPLVAAMNSRATDTLLYLNKDIYIRSYCDRIVESTVTQFTANMLKGIPLTEVAAEQLLLDLYVIRGCLMNIPQLAGKTMSSLYEKHVKKALNRIEIVLKVILTSAFPREGLIQNYAFLIGDSSAANFQKILEIKGVPKSDLKPFLKLFETHIAGNNELVKESPIMSSIVLPKTNEQPAHASSHTRVPSLNLSSSTRFEGLRDFNFKAEVEKLAQPNGTANKINENFKRMFKRDGSASPSSNSSRQ